jgi:hypothetical protein
VSKFLLLPLTFVLKCKIDALPNSLIDSIVSPKVKTMQEEKIEVCSLAHSISGVKRACWSSRMGTRWVTSRSIIHTNQTTSWLMHSWNIFASRLSHGHTWIHKIHHGPDFKETTTFPLIVYSMISHRGYIQMSFCPKTLKLGILKFSKLGFLALWKAITSCVNLWLSEV